MALSYQNVYLGSDEEGIELKRKIKQVADANGFHSASEFCRYAITEQLAVAGTNTWKGPAHDQNAATRTRKTAT